MATATVLIHLPDASAGVYGRNGFSSSSRGGSSSWSGTMNTLRGLQGMFNGHSSSQYRRGHSTHGNHYHPRPQHTHSPHTTYRTPTYRPPTYQPPTYRPPTNTYRPPTNTYRPPVSTVTSTPPRNTIPQRTTRSTDTQPANRTAFHTYLTGAQREAAKASAQEADKLAETAKDQLLNDPKLKDTINGDRDVRQALEQYEQTGDPSALENLRKDPNTPASVKDKIDIVIASSELSDQIRNGGLNTDGAGRSIDRLRDRVNNSNNLTPAEKDQLDRVADSLETSNERRKIVDLLAQGGYGGGQGGGLTSIDPAMIPPDGPLFIDEPVDDAEGQTVTSGVVLRNPADNGATIHYLLGGQTFSMEPGQSQRLERSYVIEFDRGDNFGTARYTIADGTFEFTLTDRGWNLRKKTYEVTIDNSRFPADFGYLLDGQAYTVKQGEVRRHSSAYPMLVEFDRGDGGQPAHKQLHGGTYTVGVDVNEGRLDLFAGGETLPSPRLTAN